MLKFLTPHYINSEQLQVNTDKNDLKNFLGSYNGIINDGDIKKGKSIGFD